MVKLMNKIIDESMFCNNIWHLFKYNLDNTRNFVVIINKYCYIYILIDVSRDVKGNNDLSMVLSKYLPTIM